MAFTPRPELDPVKDYDELVAHIADQTGLTEEIVRQWLGPLTEGLEAGATPDEIRANVDRILQQRPNRRARRTARSSRRRLVDERVDPGTHAELPGDAGRHDDGVERGSVD